MRDRSDLASQLEALQGVRVAVVGDVMLDRFIYGSVERISPEAPIPVMSVSRETSMLGAAGNVLRNLVALGTRPSFFSVVGDDAPGREVRALVQEEMGERSGLLVEAQRRTTIKLRYIASGQQLLRADQETTAPLAASTAADLVAAAGRAFATAQALVLSDYGKGVLRPPTLSSLIEKAKWAGLPVVVDPKGHDYTIYRGASLITPNRRELHEATGFPVDEDFQIVVAGQKVIAKCGIDAVLVTRSDQGMTLLTGEGTVHHFTTEAREVFDVSGAGDTVVAVLGAALGAGLAPEDAARLANVAAGIVVGKVGTAVAYPGEMLRALYTSHLMAVETKIGDLESTIERVHRWRQAGLKIGFTNGCFDLLHPGHVSLLHQARQACDRLIVGLNSDGSVARLKGEGRPVQQEAARAVVLASLASVDQVVIFGEDTPVKLIGAIRPDVLVKGADYTVETVVGADIVQAYGGRILLADLADGYSTSATIRRIAK